MKFPIILFHFSLELSVVHGSSHKLTGNLGLTHGTARYRSTKAKNGWNGFCFALFPGKLCLYADWGEYQPL